MEERRQGPDREVRAPAGSHWAAAAPRWGAMVPYGAQWGRTLPKEERRQGPDREVRAPAGPHWAAAAPRRGAMAPYGAQRCR